MTAVYDIYKAIDREVPFSSAESWDNCGLLCGDPSAEVKKVITALDITKDVILEAERVGAELIVSHHPVIFTPRKAVLANSPEGMLLKGGISAICTHTPFDMAPIGMNKGLFDLLNVPLGLMEKGVPLEDMGNGNAVGMVYDMKNAISPAECAKKLKEALSCTVVRFADGGKSIKRIAVCSGSGGSFLDTAAALGADALVTGDVKHDVLIDAHNNGISLFDCGHFHTERIFCGIMAELIKNAFPELEVCMAESCKDPAEYV
ncbi:MAG: Nif3-like dinuclear metal center hexameric protein [Huintestinicola sp.]